jgi:hypothetical protein
VIRLLEAIGTLLRKSKTKILPKGIIKIDTSEGFPQIREFKIESDFQFVER